MSIKCWNSRLNAWNLNISILCKLVLQVLETWILGLETTNKQTNKQSTKDIFPLGCCDHNKHQAPTCCGGLVDVGKKLSLSLSLSLSSTLLQLKVLSKVPQTSLASNHVHHVICWWWCPSCYCCWWCPSCVVVIVFHW